MARDPASLPTPASTSSAVTSVGMRELWRLMNDDDRTIGVEAAQIARGLLFVAYLLILVFLHDPRHPSFDLLRGGIVVYAVAGIVGAGRFTYRVERYYQIGLVALMSLASGYVHAVQGNPGNLLVITGLATFIPLLFLQAGRDIVTSWAILVAGHAALLALYPPVKSPLATVILMLGGAAGAGTAGGLALQAYYALLEHSRRWWQGACERERALREFSELATRTIEEPKLLAQIAAGFRAAFGGGHSLLLLAEEGGEGFSMVADAGRPAELCDSMPGGVLPPHSAALVRELIETRKPFVRGCLGEKEVAALRSRGALQRPALALVALPIIVGDIVTGAVVLTDQDAHRITAEDIGLWQAMASQAGAAIARTRLLGRLTALVSELDEARAQAEAASRAKSAFIANTSHEIRTPMNGVLGALELLLGGSLGQEEREYAETARRSAEGLLTILNDILDFSKIEAGKLVLESVDFELAAVLDESLAVLVPVAHAKGLRTTSAVAAGVPEHLHGDPLRLRQILVNLLGNAVKFTSVGEIGVRVDLLADGPEGPTLRFAVHDTGIGIPPGRVENLFESFSQADTSTTRRFGGTGLGLAICKQLATLMGGEIGAESEMGRGSTFWFSARLARGEAPSEPAAVAPPALPGASRALLAARVLVAEDNSVNQLVVRRMLERMGCRVDVVATGREAVAAARRATYDLILMDQHMPDQDGIEATREIRASEAEAGRRTPIVALTASALEEDRQRCRDAGMDDFLAKPLAWSALHAVIARHTPPPAQRSDTSGSSVEPPAASAAAS